MCRIRRASQTTLHGRNRLHDTPQFFRYSLAKEGRNMSIWDRVTNVELLRKEIKRLEAELARAKAKAAEQ